MKKLLLFHATILVGLLCDAQSITKCITIDQFGYRPDDEKVAVIRNSKTGDIAKLQYSPCNELAVVNSQTSDTVFKGNIALKNTGTSGDAYGDEVWWFDFTPVSEEGRYYIVDRKNNTRSYAFSIGEDVYNNLLRDAVRMFFYQRAGCEKAAKYAGAGWADAASHVGRLQDKNCRLYSKKNDKSTERDLHGGWFDAGDYNKYTTWACNYINDLLTAYQENPTVWGDNYNIPESGNGVPDILDEVRWGLDWLKRMQETDGSVLCVVGLDAASPPSSATGQSLYGPATTNASYAAARAFAIGSIVFQTWDKTYATDLHKRAVQAWTWAETHPNVEFYNAKNNLASGEQEGGSGDRLFLKMAASLYLYELTGEAEYLAVFESNYKKLTLFQWSNYTDQYRSLEINTMLHYIGMAGVSESIKANITSALLSAFNRSEDFAGKLGKDAYRSFIKDYNWGSNSYKSLYGYWFYKLADVSGNEKEYLSAALDYAHYLHGTNPFAMVWLTNMNERGATNSANQMYHSWFCHGSRLWDDAASSVYGPAPGYLIGGAYKNYSLDECCPNSCGSAGNNSLCTMSLAFASTEPMAKRYHDFNDSWPINSWSVTEPSCGYQVNYIKLLSKFVSTKGVVSGDSYLERYENTLKVFPNPTDGIVNIVTENTETKNVKLFDAQMKQVISLETSESTIELNLNGLPAGVYFLQVANKSMIFAKEIVKK